MVRTIQTTMSSNCLLIKKTKRCVYSMKTNIHLTNNLSTAKLKVASLQSDKDILCERLTQTGKDLSRCHDKCESMAEDLRNTTKQLSARLIPSYRIALGSIRLNCRLAFGRTLKCRLTVTRRAILFK
jgi:hypothetical protein